MVSIPFDPPLFLAAGRSTSERIGDEEGERDGAGTHSEAAAETEAEERTARELAQAAVTQPHWPWESVRNKIRSALQEINVLLDVINIAKDKRSVRPVNT